MRDSDFERLYAAHAPQVFSFLAYRTGDRTLAEDLLSETFERALRARRRFDRRRGSELTWLYAIALNLLKDRIRSEAAQARAFERTASAIPAGLSADPALEAVHERDRLRQALEILTDVEREAIALRFGGDLTNVEIARVTGERLATVEGRVYRALRRLREVLE